MNKLTQIALAVGISLPVPSVLNANPDFHTNMVVNIPFVSQLISNEGAGGDSVIPNLPTGYAGVTRGALDYLGIHGLDPTELSKRDAVRLAFSMLRKLERDFEKNVPGYTRLSLAAKKSLLDTAYNIGPGIMYYPKLTSYIYMGDEKAVVTELLDTANVKGYSVKGLAVRRAKQYNRVVHYKSITDVYQSEDGTVAYYHDDNGVFDLVYKYKPSKGRHPNSKYGWVSLK
jgi:hypothetical protein